MKTSDRAWLTLAAAVTTYEICCPNDELLSDAMRTYRAAHPTLTVVIVLTVAAHLLGWLPQRVDPLHRAAVAFRRESSGAVADAA